MNAPSLQRIRIVDDDESLREAIAFVLEGEGYAVVEYESAEDFLARDDLRTPGCLLLDVKMPGISGLGLFERLREAGVTLPVIFLSAHGDIDIAVDVMQKGAVSFLPKPVSSEKLLAAIERTRETAPSEPIHTPLSERERQVVSLVVSGLTNREVAERLGLSKRTVEFFRAGAMRKLGCHNLDDLRRVAPIVLG